MHPQRKPFFARRMYVISINVDVLEGVILKSVGHNCVKFVETFLNWKNDMMSSRLTFADHDQTIEGGGILLWRGLSACKCDGETCWKKDLLKQICGGRHDNSLCTTPTPFISREEKKHFGYFICAKRRSLQSFLTRFSKKSSGNIISVWCP